MNRHNGPIVVTAAASDPVTTAEAKTYCQIDGSTSDTLIGSFITAATEYIQKRTGQQFISATLKETWDVFPDALAFAGNGTARRQYPAWLMLDRRPVTSISFVKYYDTDGTLTTASTSDYWTDLNSRPARIFPTDAVAVWPDTQVGRPESVQVQYVVGYASASAVPEVYKVAIKALVKHWYNNREPTISTGAVPQAIPYSVEALIHTFETAGYV